MKNARYWIMLEISRLQKVIPGNFFSTRGSWVRKRAGFTQEQFAERTEYSVEFISFVERGVNSPSIEGCARIAKALEISLKDLFDF